MCRIAVAVSALYRHFQYGYEGIRERDPQVSLGPTVAELAQSAAASPV
jgi:hypothetical protein